MASAIYTGDALNEGVSVCALADGNLESLTARGAEE